MDNKRLLVVDDEQSILSLLTAAFTKRGYEVQTADSAEAALELQEKDTHWVIFSDLRLPGIDGLELCRRVRNDYPFAILFAVTGYASAYELFDCRQAGFEDYFTKPVKLELLYDAAEHAFTKLDRWKRGQNKKD